jgi:hypothetical protein
MSDKIWAIAPKEILYLDNTRIIFRDDHGTLHIGVMSGLQERIGSSAYSSESITVRCNQLFLEGRTY